jgi:hypothetical protein
MKENADKKSREKSHTLKLVTQYSYIRGSKTNSLPSSTNHVMSNANVRLYPVRNRTSLRRYGQNIIMNSKSQSCTPNFNSKEEGDVYCYDIFIITNL